MEDYIDKIIIKVLNSTAIKIDRIANGYSGFVYKVLASKQGIEKYYIVKMYETVENDRHDDVTQRVYGHTYASLIPIYNLMQNNKIPTYSILVHSNPTKEIPYFYQVLSYLEGQSVREYITWEKAIDTEQLHEISGEAFAKLHSITKEFDSWVYQETPYALSWKNAFFNSIKSILDLAAKTGNKYMAQNKNIIINFVDKNELKWIDPSKYVLSHCDGLQGIVKYANGTWNYVGHIDLEDYKFMDQRMALAGYEIAVEFEDAKVPGSFWKGYKKITKVDNSYDDFKNLFKLYYLLAWFPLVYESDWRGNPEDKEYVIGKFENSFKKVLSDRISI